MSALPVGDRSAPTPDHEKALNVRRDLLLQYAVKTRYQVGLLPSQGNTDDRRKRDENGKPINSLQAITNAVKLLSVELRHEYPLPPPGDGGEIGDESPLITADDPLGGVMLIAFPDPPPSPPARKKARKA